MKENENKITGFIKTKLNKSEESSDGWDKPDARIWVNSKKDIFKSKNQNRRLLPFALWTMGLLLTLLAIMLFWNKENKIKTLEAQLINQTEYNSSAMLIKESSISDLQATNMLLLQQSEDAAAENQVLQTQNSILNQRLHNLSNEVVTKEELIKSYLSAQASDNSLSLPIVPVQETTTENRFVQGFKYLPSFDFGALSTNKNEEKSPEIQIKSLPKDTWSNKLEVSYGLGFFEFQSSKKLTVKDGSKTSVSSNQSNYKIGHNVHVTYGLSKNVFIKTGLNTVSVSNAQNFNLYTKYNKSTEYKNPDGSIGNTFKIQSSDDYSQNDASINIDVPTSLKLENGDILITNYQYNEKYRWFQVPIEMEYRTGGNKLQGLVSVGASWNIIHFQDYEVKALVESKNGAIPVKNVNYTQNNSIYKTYFGIQTGLGAIYPFSKRMYFRSDASLRYDFTFLNKDIRVGIGYKF